MQQWTMKNDRDICDHVRKKLKCASVKIEMDRYVAIYNVHVNTNVVF